MTLRAMDEICSPTEYDKAHQVYYRHHLHHHGIFDWKEIFNGSNLNFGEYTSSKLDLIKN